MKFGAFLSWLLAMRQKLDKNSMYNLDIIVSSIHGDAQLKFMLFNQDESVIKNVFDKIKSVLNGENKDKFLEITVSNGNGTNPINTYMIPTEALINSYIILECTEVVIADPTPTGGKVVQFAERQNR